MKYRFVSDGYIEVLETRKEEGTPIEKDRQSKWHRLNGLGKSNRVVYPTHTQSGADNCLRRNEAWTQAE